MLFGKNSGGKTTILKAMQYLSSHLKLNKIPKEITTSSGEIISFVDMRDIIHGKKDNGFPIRIGCSFDSNLTTALERSKWKKKWKSIDQNRFPILSKFGDIEKFHIDLWSSIKENKHRIAYSIKFFNSKKVISIIEIQKFNKSNIRSFMIPSEIILDREVEKQIVDQINKCIKGKVFQYKDYRYEIEKHFKKFKVKSLTKIKSFSSYTLLEKPYSSSYQEKLIFSPAKTADIIAIDLTREYQEFIEEFARKIKIFMKV